MARRRLVLTTEDEGAILFLVHQALCAVPLIQASGIKDAMDHADLLRKAAKVVGDEVMKG